jgi:Fur family peroxide stress response transcriptional regulator
MATKRESARSEQLVASCRRKGIRLTHQRRVILEILARRKDHPTADQLYGEARERLPEISRTTVYRVLEMLVRSDAARTVCHPGSTARYEAQTARHHHLICRHCGRLIDLVAPELDELPLPRTRGRGFRIEDYTIQFMGSCSDCRRKTGTRGG